jgi:uncharacterized protein (TIGR02001 family)
MNKKLIALLLGGLTAGAFTSVAQTATTATTPATTTPAAAPAAPAAAAPAAPAAPSLSIVLTPTYVSSYMFRGQRLGGQAFQPSIEADYGNWALGLWTSFPIADKVDGQSDPETDPYGSYTFTINDNLSIVPAFTWYGYMRAPTDEGFFRDTFEPSVTLNYTVDGVKISPEIFYDVVLDTETTQISFAYTVPLKQVNSELDFLAQAGDYYGTNVIKGANPKYKAWGDYWLVGVTAPYSFNDKAKLSVGWAYTEGDNAYYKQPGTAKFTNGSAVGRGVLTVSFAYTF